MMVMMILSILTGGVSLRELNVLESDMLNMLSFSLFVDVESYFRYFLQLQKYFLHINMDFVRTVSPVPLVEDFGRIIHPPHLPSTPSPCLIPHNNHSLLGHQHHHHHHSSSNNNYQSFPFPTTMYATDPSGSLTKNSSSSPSLMSSSWMSEHGETTPWSCELSHDSSLSLDVGDDFLFADGPSSSGDGEPPLHNNSMYLHGG